MALAVEICIVGYTHPNRKSGHEQATAIRLPDETYERLQALAERTGRTATYYIRQAIEAHLEDLEDLYLAAAQWSAFAAVNPRSSVARNSGVAWTIEFDFLARKQVQKLDPQTRSRIRSFLYERLALLDDPRQLGDALQGSTLAKFWRCRLGDYRIICDLQDHRLVVLVVDVGHRRDVHRS